ncbi:DUF2460 domain-containing protein [Variovorax sp. LT1R16]|uniref:DUF2460 domain-containing protein n=1 Tax=Variovorax sp. LT1R16 TaxID=3443728 RepID=UPI003F44CA7A
MAYLDTYLDIDPAYGWQGGPSFQTRIVSMKNGRERRNAERSEARHSFGISFEHIEREEYRKVKQHHLVCRGRLHCFPFRDALDFEAAGEIFGQGDGATTVFQLCKISVLDGVSYVRNCYVIPKAVITENGSPVTPTIDPRRGLVTFSAAPAAGVILRWSGQFDIWVRFDQDDLPFSIPAFEMATGAIDLIEVPPPGEGE